MCMRMCSRRDSAESPTLPLPALLTLPPGDRARPRHRRGAGRLADLVETQLLRIT